MAEGYRLKKRTARHKRLKTRRVTPELILRMIKEVPQIRYFLAYAQEVGLAGIKRACGVDIWRSNLDDVFAIGRDNVVFAYLNMRESRKGAIDSSSNQLALRVEVDIFNSDNRAIAKDYFIISFQLTETGSLEVESGWLYDPDSGWPHGEDVMTEIFERVVGTLEILSTFRMPMTVVAA